MKKALLLLLCLAFLVGCNTDSEIISGDESVDLTKIIDPDTATAEAKYDNTQKGIYRGVFASDDMEFHGVLTVNLGNDAQYNAVLVYGDNQRMGFVRVNNGSTSIENVIEFRGNNAGFTLDVSNYMNPVVTDGYVGGRVANMRVVKEKSAQRTVIVLGSFTDDTDPNFFGAWDLIGNSGQTVISVPTDAIDLPPGMYPDTVDVTVDNLDEVIVTVNGVMFSDDKMESFRAGPNCFTLLPSAPTDKFAPFASGRQTQQLVPLIPIFPTFEWDIDEYAAGKQVSIFSGDPATWEIGYSYAARGWPNNGNEGKYYNINCVETPLGGTWRWRNRRGRILLTL